jgi:hypothetical protein
LNPSEFLPVERGSRTIARFTKGYKKLTFNGVKPEELFKDGRPVGIVPAFEKILNCLVNAKLEHRFESLSQSFNQRIITKKDRQTRHFLLSYKTILLSIVNNGDNNLESLKEILSSLSPNTVFYGNKITDQEFIIKLKNNPDLRDDVAEFLNNLIVDNIELYPTELFIFARSSANRAISPEIYSSFQESKRW